MGDAGLEGVNGGVFGPWITEETVSGEIGAEPTFRPFFNFGDTFFGLEVRITLQALEASLMEEEVSVEVLGWVYVILPLGQVLGSRRGASLGRGSGKVRVAWKWSTPKAVCSLRRTTLTFPESCTKAAIRRVRGASGGTIMGRLNWMSSKMGRVALPVTVMPIWAIGF